MWRAVARALSTLVFTRAASEPLHQALTYLTLTPPFLATLKTPVPLFQVRGGLEKVQFRLLLRLGWGSERMMRESEVKGSSVGAEAKNRTNAKSRGSQLPVEEFPNNLISNEWMTNRPRELI